MNVASKLADRLRLPVIAAPLFLVSGPDLVINCCKEGVVGTFPSLNLRTAEAFEGWLIQITTALARYDAEHTEAPSAPFGVNIIAHKTNKRLDEDMDLVERHRVPMPAHRSIDLLCIRCPDR
jgi:nitronate monooxygenase